MLEFGVSDLGGISQGKDHVNPDSSWGSIEEISKKIRASGYKLRGRLPIYKKYYELSWYSDEVGGVIEKYLNKEEFRYYKIRRQ